MKERGETITDSMLAALPAHLRPSRSGKYLRCGCPFHGSDKQRSLSISTETGRFQCHSCGAWGYTERAREDWKARHGGASRPSSAPWERRSSGVDRLRTITGPDPVPISEDELRQLREWQARLPEASAYLAGRRIPLDLVRELGGGVGDFAGARRLVLPHTDPDGRTVSWYGRRIDGGEDRKHHHRAGPRGWLNAQAARGEEVWLTEGAFDALALMAAGIPQAVAVFGVSGIRWPWLRTARRIVFAFDVDAAGLRALKEHARQALLRGAEVLTVTAEELGGAKDIAEAWAAGTLRLQGVDPQPAPTTEETELERLRARVAALPDAAPTGLRGEAWLDYCRQSAAFSAEWLEVALAAGWSALDLFGLPHPSRPWAAGALWLLGSYEITEVTPEGIVGVTARGGRLVAARGQLQPDRLPWLA